MNALELQTAHENGDQAVRCDRQMHGMYSIDFGCVWFGTLRICTGSSSAESLTIRLGEVLGSDGRIDRDPPGLARFRELSLPLRASKHCYDLVIPSDAQNTGNRTIEMPEEMGEVMPFRYAEIDGFTETLTADDVRLVAVHYPYDGDASDFESSDDVLNRIWELRRRYQIVWLWCEGGQKTDIAPMLFCHRNTVRNVLNRFEEKGELGLIDGRVGNGSPKVSEGFVQTVKMLVAGSPPKKVESEGLARRYDAFERT